MADVRRVFARQFPMGHVDGHLKMSGQDWEVYDTGSLSRLVLVLEGRDGTAVELGLLVAVPGQEMRSYISRAEKEDRADPCNLACGKKIAPYQRLIWGESRTWGKRKYLIGSSGRENAAVFPQVYYMFDGGRGVILWPEEFALIGSYAAVVQGN